MHVHESGPRDAPSIVFLHGTGANADMWAHHAEYFADYHCLIPQFPGFGRSAREPWVSLAAIADEVASLIADRADGQAHVVGVSLGGVVTMKLLAARPALVDHAVVDGAGVLPFPGLLLIKLGLRGMRPFIKTSLVTGTIARVLGFPGAARDNFRRNFRQMSSQAFVSAIIAALDFREPAGLRTASPPTLFVAGEREPQATRTSNRMLAAAMPHATARIVPGRHHGWIAADPLLHCRMVEAWINDRPLPDGLAAAE
jgi:pimeloyl-ACP methyl ester carboxylesterase